jgi:hypothetical protein
VVANYDKEGGAVNEQCVEQKKLSLEEFVLGAMRILQLHCGVRDFPPSNNRAWEEFIYSAIKEWENLFSQPLDVEFYFDDADLGFSIKNCENLSFAIFVTTTIDPNTRRMRLDANSEWGKELGKQFPNFADALFKFSLSIDGFVEIG